MKLSRKALISAAVTGLLPTGGKAANFNVNLTLNPSFETVTGRDAANWSGNVTTYLYSQAYTGPAPTGAGLVYWNGGGADPLATQLVDLAANSAQIDAGLIGYELRAFFSTYLGQLDYANVRAIFLDGSNAQVGSAAIGGAAFVAAIPGGSGLRDWAEDTDSGLLPAGTRTVRLELDGEKQPGVGAAADGYVDLVNFQIAQVPEPGTLSLLGVGMASGWFLTRWRRRRN